MIWRITPLGTPAVIRSCNKCGGKQLYASANRFRVNANGRRLDVWLIYKCTRCENTWNMTVHEQVKPESMPRDKYQAYIDNDASLALACAFDKALLRRNNAVACYDEVAYSIEGEVPGAGGAAEIVLTAEVEPDVRVSALLRQKLELSQARFRELAETGRIRDRAGGDVRKLKMKNGMGILVELPLA